MATWIYEATGKIRRLAIDETNEGGRIKLSGGAGGRRERRDSVSRLQQQNPTHLLSLHVVAKDVSPLPAGVRIREDLRCDNGNLEVRMMIAVLRTAPQFPPPTRHDGTCENLGCKGEKLDDRMVSVLENDGTFRGGRNVLPLPAGGKICENLDWEIGLLEVGMETLLSSDRSLMPHRKSPTRSDGTSRRQERGAAPRGGQDLGKYMLKTEI
ncbi:hypothetical protein Hypma_006151 [Hypsizygus marmoreus]|uniref:Uncharacterized protein n=1 Tax=Hypsizygus marmoreus TaxID=39966 RepID=A0A369K2T0_HYPMA|nr:hypothetical protein Hypma_006151 [Hypsizygus marmoreus]